MLPIERLIVERELKIKILEEQIEKLDLEIYVNYKELEYFMKLLQQIKKRSLDAVLLSLFSKWSIMVSSWSMNLLKVSSIVLPLLILLALNLLY